MDMSTTIAAGITRRLKTLKYYIPSVPLGLIVILIVLALMAIWLGVSSVNDDTSPIRHTPPKMLVQTTPLPSTPPTPLV